MRASGGAGWRRAPPRRAWRAPRTDRPRPASVAPGM
jgi:hypothetical protein